MGKAMDSPRILFVDDDPVIFGIAGPAIRKIDLTPLNAPDLGAARKILDEQPPDLMVLDLHLPDGSGFDLLREIREERKLDFPILILSVRTAVADRVKGFQLGAQDYISKPFAIEELQQRILVHLPASKSEVTESERSGDGVRQRLQDDAIDMIVHDLKSPLTSILGSLSILKDSGLIDTSDMNRLLDLSERSGGRMLLMINDILDVRSGKSSYDVQPVDFSLSDLVREIADQFKLPAAAQGTSIQTEIGSEGMLQTDKTLLFRIVANLVSNALKVSPEGGVVEIEAGVSEGKCRIRVLDRGPGVPDEEKERIFEKGVRLGSITYAGSGIGLAFCRGASRALGGDTSVENREGGGSTFLCEVPAIAASSDSAN